MTDWRDDPQVQREAAEDALLVDVNEHLALAMELRGLTRSQLATMCGVDKSEVTRRLKSGSNLTIKVVADTLFEMGFGLEVGLVDRQDRNRTTRLRSYEREFEFEQGGGVVHLHGRPVGQVRQDRPVRAWGGQSR